MAGGPGGAEKSGEGFVIPVLSGLLAGSLHVLSGPDHLAAVAPITVADWKRSCAIGFRWGLGHASGVIFIGLLALLFREVLPMEAISSYSERLVGVILIVLGLWGLRRALRTHVHTHAHTHDGSTHVHYHVHSAGHGPEGTQHAPGHSHIHTAFGIGTVHGLAGSSHFFGVLPALVFTSQMESISYLAAYGVGTIGAMIGFSGVLGAVAHRCLKVSAVRYKFLAISCSVVALVVGGWWVAGF